MGMAGKAFAALALCAGLAAGCLTADRTATETRPGKVRVAVYVDRGSFAVGPYRHLEIASGAERTRGSAY